MMNNFSTALFICLFLNCLELAAQSPVASAAAEKTAPHLFDENTFLQASTRAQETAALLNRSLPILEQADSAMAIGKRWMKADSFHVAEQYFFVAVICYEMICPKGCLSLAVAQRERAKALLELENGRDASTAIEESLAILNAIHPNNHQELALSTAVKARISHARGNYQEAVSLYEQALQLAEMGFEANSSEIAKIKNPLGLNYDYTGAHEKGIAYIEQALAIFQKNAAAHQEEIGNCYLYLGVCYNSLKQYDIALQYFQQALDIQLEIYGENAAGAAYCYSLMGQAYLGKNDFEKANELFLKQEQIMLKIGGGDNTAFAFTAHDRATAFFAQKNYQAAIEWEKKALDLLQGPAKKEGQDVAALYLHLGRAYSANGNFQEAVQAFEEDHRILMNIFGKDCDLLYYSHADLGKTFLKWHLKTGDQKLLEESRNHYNAAEKSLEAQLLKKTNTRKQKKLLIEALPIYEQAIEAEKLSASLEKAWELSETMHSFLLYITTQEANARQFAGIPAAKLQEDSLLRHQMAALELKKFELLENGTHQLTNPEILEINRKIFDAQYASRQLQAYFESHFPDYFRLKYDLKPIALSQAQQLLTPQQTLVEYFCGDSSLSVFVLKPDTAFVLGIPRDFPLLEWVNALRNDISSYHNSEQNDESLYEKSVTSYAKHAHLLYQKLLVPIQGQLSSELIIIPGEGLNNLPFEALLKSPPSDLGNFKTYPFLIRKHAVQYAYSATLFQQMSKQIPRTKNKLGLLAFAPFFNLDSSALAVRTQGESIAHGLSRLQYSGEEVLRVKEIYGSNAVAYLGQQASKKVFLEMAGSYDVLHLATHAKANVKAGEFSFLAFAPTDSEPNNSLISVGELYNCSLNASMVVLSACETGLGEEVRGEGVLSLARAFAFAGARSIVCSLWSVNDKSTMRLMDYFYELRGSGQTNSLTLQNAKLKYLKENPGAGAHPFYWAGFVAIGE